MNQDSPFEMESFFFLSEPTLTLTIYYLIPKNTHAFLKAPVNWYLEEKNFDF
jgi:hypothetical protein